MPRVHVLVDATGGSSLPLLESFVQVDEASEGSTRLLDFFDLRVRRLLAHSRDLPLAEVRLALGIGEPTIGVCETDLLSDYREMSAYVKLQFTVHSPASCEEEDITQRGERRLVPEQKMGLFALLSPFTKLGALRISNMVMPLDHQSEFYLSVGAAKDNAALKDHVITILGSWTLVGVLIVGVAVSMIDFVQPSSIAITMAHTWRLELFYFGICWFTACSALIGPVLLGSVLLTNSRACAEINFDLFMIACRPIFIFNEACLVATCWGLVILFALLAWVTQENVYLATVLTVAYLGCTTLMLVFINMSTALNVHGDLLVDKRAAPIRTFQFNTKDALRTEQKEVVRTLVANAMGHPDGTTMLHNYAWASGKASCPAYQRESSRSTSHSRRPWSRQFSRGLIRGSSHSDGERRVADERRVRVAPQHERRGVERVGRADDAAAQDCGAEGAALAGRARAAPR
ncbi:MAG: hypothetical protein SGPRY_013932, partial [Prymnesium sp.]